MKHIITNIRNKEYDAANAELAEAFKSIVEKKLWERRKAVGAKMCEQPMDRAKKLAADVIEEDEEQLDEARVKIIKARVRGGKVQRRKKVSNVPGYRLQGNKLQRMSAAERRRRKLGAKRAKIKRKTKLSRALMKRKRSLRRRASLGV